ncbi:MAG: DUF2227 family putative metal-binding protein [Parachlamydiales bacterium]|nr:DUF2227 family putative metal-binding protein [Parachlamydiales bacterium]
MAQYKTHASFNILLALPAIIWGMIYFFHPALNLLIIFIGCYIYATLFMNPDLDIANKIKFFSIRGLLSIPFRSYSMIFRHRGISHSIFLGTISRVLWLAAILFLILFLINRSTPKQNDIYSLIKNEKFIYGFFGIFLADFCHILLDLKPSKN